MPIAIQCNLKTGDFLDVTFVLSNNTHNKPFRKKNNEPIYINKHFNHPPSIQKQFPKLTEKRIAETSSNQDIFDESIKERSFKRKWLQKDIKLLYSTHKQQKTKK